MRKMTRYRILQIALMSSLVGMAVCGPAWAQQTSNKPADNEIYCSGLSTTQPVPANTYIISGENSAYLTGFIQGEQVYLNHGSDQGVKVGDQYEVIRPTRNFMRNNPWFRWQTKLMNAMGTHYADLGRLRVVHVLPKTSIAEVTFSCAIMQRGDIVRPFVPRPAPPFHSAKLNPFAPPSGKPTAMIVTGKDFAPMAGVGSIVYINLGSTQGVKVGDYFRVFRYQGTHNESVYQISNTAYKLYGFGSTPVAYHWNNLPRQILGEGIVLRTSPNSSTVLVTDSRQGIFAGDYVEIE